MWSFGRCLTDGVRLILDTPGYRLGPCGGHGGVLLADLPSAGAGDGLDQLVAVPDAQQLLTDLDVDVGAGVGDAETDLLPGHADHAVARDSSGQPGLAAPVGAQRGQL